MDFIKSCSTNVLSVSGSNLLDYKIYQDEGGTDSGVANNTGQGLGIRGVGSTEKKERTMAELLRKTLLARSIPGSDRILVFAGHDEATSLLGSQGYKLHEGGNLDASALFQPSSTATTSQHTFGLFLASLEAAISASLAEDFHAVQLRSLTWILPVEQRHATNDAGLASDTSEHVMISVRPQVSAGKHLFFLPVIQPTSLRPLCGAWTEPTRHIGLMHSNVVLAPMGQSAVIVGDCAQDGTARRMSESTDNFPMSRKKARARLWRRSQDTAWQQTVIATLDQKGWCSTYAERAKDLTQWVRVKFLDSPTSMQSLVCLWPVALCFVQTSDIEAASHMADTSVAKPFLDDHNTYQDPLKSAELWLSNAEERARAEIENQHSNHTPDQTHAHIAAPVETGAEAQPSPLFQRAQEIGALSGIYPTPPDVIAPNSGPDAEALTVQATSVDMVGSNPASSDEFNADYDAESYRNSNAELFGDADDDIFGPPDVTDADFSFFDDTDAPIFSIASATESQTEGARLEINPGISAPMTIVDGHVQSPNDEQAMASEFHSRDADGSMQAHIGPGSNMNDIDTSTKHSARVFSSSAVTNGALHSSHSEVVSTPPLSPFSIKESLFPLPIPASLVKDEPTTLSQVPRRDSNFEYVAFHDGITSSNAKYSKSGRFGNLDEPTNPITITRQSRIALAKDRGRTSQHSRLEKRYHRYADRKHLPSVHNTAESSRVESSGDESSDGEPAESDMTHYSPIQVSSPRKRKWVRDGSDFGQLSQDFRLLMSESEEDSDISDHETLSVDHQALIDLLLVSGAERLFSTTSQQSIQENVEMVASLRSDSPLSGKINASFWALFEFGPVDMIAVAQIILEQSKVKLASEQDPCPESPSPEARKDALQDIARHAVNTAIGGQPTAECDLVRLASFSIPPLLSTTTQQDVAPKLQPRPIPRRSAGSLPGNAGHHLLPVPTPLVRMRRAEAAWDFLPSALHFWETLGLEPSSGPKDVLAYGVVLGNADLGRVITNFLGDLGTAYAGCKLGSHLLDTDLSFPDGHKADNTSDGVLTFGTTDHPNASNVLESLHTACIKVGKALRTSSRDRSGTTAVVYIFDMFKDASMTKYICASFWALYKEFRKSDLSATAPNDVLLQIVPLDAVAESDRLVVHESAWLAVLARTVYDRCPSTTPSNLTPAWRIPCAPCVELVNPPTRKIYLSLSERAPKNLMQEAQILHLAYAVSADGRWLTAAWTDYAGKYQYASCFSLHGSNVLDVLSEIKSITTAMLSVETTWRLFVARIGSMTETERRCWETFSGALFAVTLLDVDIAPSLQIAAPTESTTDAPPSAQPGAGFVTPAATPQPSTFTVSPEAQNSHTPSTPAPAEAAPEPGAPDADIQLMDTTDETWALLLPFSATRSPSPYELKRVLASGMLIKRGDRSLARTLPSLGLDLLAVVPPEIPLGRATWLMPRTHEALLREVQAWYRGLGLLAKLRRIAGAETGVIPWHIAVAVSGSEHLNGFLS